MARVISVHEYTLKPGVDPREFEAAIQAARSRGVLQLPGLETHYLLRGLRGDRKQAYAAVWVYSSREAWEALWGPPGQPKPKSEYPKRWKVWEDEVLAPFLSEDPDQIRFTAYQEL